MIRRKRENGSMTLEASLIMPIFFSFILLMVTFIRIAMVEIALNHAVFEAVKQISTHMYPVDLLYQQFSETEAGKIVDDSIEKVEETRNKVMEVEEVIKRFHALFPREAEKLLSMRETFEQELEGVYQEGLSVLFQPIVDHYVNRKLIKLERFQVTKVVLPDLRDHDPAYFGIEARYDMPLYIPFFHKTLSFKKQAYERVWVGYGTVTKAETEEPAAENKNQSDANNRDEEAEKEEKKVLLIDSITNPVQRGHSVRIIAKGLENQRAVIQLYYQSGFKKQETCRFQSNGWLTCDIKIGGHANEGKYKAVIISGDLQAEADFQVMSKENMSKYRSKRNIID